MDQGTVKVQAHGPDHQNVVGDIGGRRIPNGQVFMISDRPPVEGDDRKAKAEAMGLKGLDKEYFLKYAEFHPRWMKPVPEDKELGGGAELAKVDTVGKTKGKKRSVDE